MQELHWLTRIAMLTVAQNAIRSILVQSQSNMLKKSGKVIVVLLAIYGASELFPWSLENLFRLTLGLPRPTASAYYRLSIENRCTQDLNISVVLINDLWFTVPSQWVQRQEKRLGWEHEKQAVVCSGKNTTFVLPSNVDPRIGYVLVVARSQINDAGTGDVSQGVALYLRHWVALGEIKINIKETDLEIINLSNTQVDHKLYLK
jgi:hypothetical protein